MVKGLRKQIRRRFDRDQAGQSIVLLAFAFIALIAFTGLVTDISVMFVRYSSLRRTVDAAAIAAAQQIREGTDYGTVAFTAREFIQLHGLEPHKVWVETCETDIAQWRAGTGAWAGNPHPEGSYPEVSAMGNTELCNWTQPRKLVRVVAQIKSPTFFLKVIGIDDLTLETSSLSETAVLDVALVIDTSESMTGNTELDLHYRDWAGLNVGSGFPGTKEVRAGCYNTLAYNSTSTSWRIKTVREWKYGPCCNDPGNGKIFQDSNGNWRIYTDTNNNDAYDSGEPLGVGNNVADGDYSDLICYPFRDVKDAARNFVKRLDYVRGDRVALVTFSSLARAIPPDGKPGDSQEYMMTDEELALITLNKKVGVSAIPNDSNNPINAFPFGPIEDETGVRREVGIRDIGNGNTYIPGGQSICYEQLLAYFDFYGITDGYNPTSGDPDNDQDTLDDLDGVNLPFSVDNPNAAAIMFDYEPNAGSSARYRFNAYESVAPCPDTNIGGGIRKANDVLTNALTIRRDAVWVMILLSDGAANKTDPVPEIPLRSYGGYGFCPWKTFCNPNPDAATQFNVGPVHGECTAAAGPSNPGPQYCNDDLPDTRHFCLQWSTDPNVNGRPDPTNPDCGETGQYDADDYARDWADFAGLINVAPGIPGNFIAIFTIGFGTSLLTDPTMVTAVPLLRYIADAGDNGEIDNDIQQDWRDNGQQDGSADVGEPDVCQNAGAGHNWCGQYYYATDLSSLEAVFEAIASRLFTRLAR